MPFLLDATIVLWVGFAGEIGACGGVCDEASKARDDLARCATKAGEL